MFSSLYLVAHFLFGATGSEYNPGAIPAIMTRTPPRAFHRCVQDSFLKPVKTEKQHTKNEHDGGRGEETIACCTRKDYTAVRFLSASS